MKKRQKSLQTICEYLCQTLVFLAKDQEKAYLAIQSISSELTSVRKLFETEERFRGLVEEVCPLISILCKYFSWKVQKDASFRTIMHKKVEEAIGLFKEQYQSDVCKLGVNIS
jgi:hypothetical protein